ncbi:MAG: hypothetical protein HXY30_14715 [Pseudorhodoplanes sp.]|nr:hypothetical protein [Pseudorhodoplanes sp.]
MALAALGAVLVGQAQTQAAPVNRYDGTWSVLIITESGTCDRAYRYALRIKNGVVYYDGEAGIDVSGRVSPSGQVQVSLKRGDQGASGSGRLSGTTGLGTWSGKSSTSQCSGQWQAERRSTN